MHGGLICIALSVTPLSVCDWTKIQTGQKVTGLKISFLHASWKCTKQLHVSSLERPVALKKNDEEMKVISVHCVKLAQNL